MINKYTRCPICEYNKDVLINSTKNDNSLYVKYKEIEFP